LIRFQAFFFKFNQVHRKLEARDEALEKFKHYHRKLEKLMKERDFAKRGGMIDPISLAEHNELVERVSFS
jgi:cell fate (sporulation/competence/biofilm development) regulator YlbF (YheA/YmcA/DUF963 family)